MLVLVFGMLALLILRLSVRWPWRSIAIAAAIIGFFADAVLERWVMPH
jgi:hypothetical protein